MTDTNTGGPTGLRAAAEAKLAEIRAEQSIPPDAADLFGLVIAAQAQTSFDVESVFEQQESQSRGMTEFAQRLEALETRPQTQVSAAGVNLSALDDVKTRLQNAREHGAISGETALILDGFIAALGAAPVPPSPAPEAPPAPQVEEPAPAASDPAPAPATDGSTLTTETTATTGEGAPSDASGETAPPTEGATT